MASIPSPEHSEPGKVDPQTPTSPDGAQPDDSQLPPRAWLVRNGIYIVIFAVLAVFLYQRFGLEGLWTIVKAGLGLGLVIFVHELGHFLAAKWSDVHVETFSIGFGPALPGCRWQWGETVYKVALFPLGGYVKMLGEGDENEEAEEDPRSYQNKTVAQRMLIISAGVIMNVILACICFIGAFSHGLERPSAVIGLVDPGGPAWKAGLAPGDVVQQIGHRVATADHPLIFSDLQRTIVNTSAGQKLTLVYERYLPIGDPKARPKQIRIELEPRMEGADQHPKLGILYVGSLELPPKSAREALKTTSLPDTVAAAAREPISGVVYGGAGTGDRIVATTDPDKPTEMRDLPEVDPKEPASEQQYLFELSRRYQRLAGKPMKVRILRAGKTEEVDVKPAQFDFGEVIVATTDPKALERVIDLPPDPRFPEHGDVFAFKQRQQQLAGQFMTIRVRGENTTRDLVVPPSYHYTLGARMRMGRIAAVRSEDDSPARKAGVKPGDILKEIVLSDGHEEQRFVISQGKDEQPVPEPELIDPVKLPDELRRWAGKRKNVTATLKVLRDNANKERVPETLPAVAWDSTQPYFEEAEQPRELSSPLAITGLGLAYKVDAIVEAVNKADSALHKNDLVKGYCIKGPGKDGAPGSYPTDLFGNKKFAELKSIDQWAGLFAGLQGKSAREALLQVERGQKLVEVEIATQADPTWPNEDLGLQLMTDARLQRADTLSQAVAMGMQATWDFIVETYQHIRLLIIGRLSFWNTGGIITIGAVAYQTAGVGIWEFVFFLGVISINLAVINFLPIPFLDGGHMVFLLYELVRGKRAPESIQTTATVGGLLLLLTLMVVVLAMDVVKFFF